MKTQNKEKQEQALKELSRLSQNDIKNGRYEDVDEYLKRRKENRAK